MPIGHVNVKLRPLKIAFIVDYKKKKDVIEVIEICSFLWGGQNCCIIPFFKRIPKILKSQSYGLSPKEFIENHVETFDPDLIVNVNLSEKEKLDYKNRKVIPFKDFSSEHLKQTGMPKYGIGLFEILKAFIDQEFKYIAKNPPNITVPQIPKKDAMFLSALFGNLPRVIEQEFWNGFAPISNAIKEEIDITNFGNLLSNGKLFIRRLSNLYTGKQLKIQWEECQAIIIFDKNNVLDILNYWNLRALGWKIIPISKQDYESDTTNKLIKDFIDSNFTLHRFSQNVYRKTIIIQGLSVTNSELNIFIQHLNTFVKASGNHMNPKFLIQSWIPRMWVSEAITPDFIHNCEIVTSEKRTELKGEINEIEVDVLPPQFFINDMNRSGGPYFANEISYNIIGSTKLFAEVIPSGIKDTTFSYTGFRKDWRVSKSGIVFLGKDIERTLNIFIPKAEDIMQEWMKTKGFSIKKSYAGLLAEQMYIQLEGKYGIMTTIQREGVVELISEFRNDNHLSTKDFFGKLNKIIHKQKLQIDASGLTQQITDKRILELGFDLQCPVCTQRNWYALSEMDSKLKCYKCLTIFNVPIYKPQNINMAYKANGPFSLPNYSYGSYTVLLTHTFFADTMDRPSTPMFSFNISNDISKYEMEVDIGLFFQETRFSVTENYLALAECKSFNNFELKDIKKMKKIGETFASSILVFSTLKKQLSQNEKRLIKSLVLANQKKQNKSLPYNHILILTGNELFSHERPPYCWSKEIEEKYKKNHYSLIHNIIGLCVATQEIYL
jgi:hypothetical protein